MKAETKEEEAPVYLDAKKFRGELKRRMERQQEPSQPVVRFALNEVMLAVESATLASAPPPTEAKQQ